MGIKGDETLGHTRLDPRGDTTMMREDQVDTKMIGGMTGREKGRGGTNTTTGKEIGFEIRRTRTALAIVETIRTTITGMKIGTTRATGLVDTRPLELVNTMIVRLERKTVRVGISVVGRMVKDETGDPATEISTVALGRLDRRRPERLLGNVHALGIAHLAGPLKHQ